MNYFKGETKKNENNYKKDFIGNFWCSFGF